MATNLLFCFFIQFLEQLLKFLANCTLLKYVKSQRSYGFLITKKLIFGFQILDLKVHFSASLIETPELSFYNSINRPDHEIMRKRISLAFSLNFLHFIVKQFLKILKFTDCIIS